MSVNVLCVRQTSGILEKVPVLGRLTRAACKGHVIIAQVENTAGWLWSEDSNKRLCNLTYCEKQHAPKWVGRRVKRGGWRIRASSCCYKAHKLNINTRTGYNCCEPSGNICIFRFKIRIFFLEKCKLNRNLIGSRTGRAAHRKVDDLQSKHRPNTTRAPKQTRPWPRYPFVFRHGRRSECWAQKVMNKKQVENCFTALGSC